MCKKNKKININLIKNLHFRIGFVEIRRIFYSESSKSGNYIGPIRSRRGSIRMSARTVGQAFMLAATGMSVRTVGAIINRPSQGYTEHKKSTTITTPETARKNPCPTMDSIPNNVGQAFMLAATRICGAYNKTRRDNQSRREDIIG